MELKIRKAKKEDILALVILFNSSIKQLKDFSGKKYSKKYFEPILSSKDRFLLVAESRGRICGAINGDFLDSDDYSFLDNLVVSKKFRGRGIASKLMSEFAQISKKRGLKRLVGLVYDHNENMHKIMKHYKFKDCGKTTVYAKDL